MKNILVSLTQKESLSYYNVNISYKLLPIGINDFVFNYKGINNIIINNPNEDDADNYIKFLLE